MACKFEIGDIIRPKLMQELEDLVVGIEDGEYKLRAMKVPGEPILQDRYGRVLDISIAYVDNHGELVRKATPAERLLYGV